MSDRVTPSVVLRTRAIRESDLIVVLLTPTSGKLECIARSARRSRKRFPGGLPVGARGEATVGRGRGSLASLTGFVPSRDHSGLGRDLEVFAYVAYLCELTEHLVTGSAPDAAIFARLCEALESTIAAVGKEVSPAWLRRYELGLLDALGQLPALERCGVCGAQPALDGHGLAFSLARGGVLCADHGVGAGRVKPEVTQLALSLLEAPEAGEQGWSQAYARAPRVTRRGLRDLCRASIQPQLRGKLKSLQFFAQIATPPRTDLGPSEAG